MNKWPKVLAGILITIIILLFVFIAGAYYMLNDTLPQYSGKKIVNKLNGEVSIYEINLEFHMFIQILNMIFILHLVICTRTGKIISNGFEQKSG